jgi:hypothetical protein
VSASSRTIPKLRDSGIDVTIHSGIEKKDASADLVIGARTHADQRREWCNFFSVSENVIASIPVISSGCFTTSAILSVAALAAFD